MRSSTTSTSTATTTECNREKVAAGVRPGTDRDHGRDQEQGGCDGGGGVCYICGGGGRACYVEEKVEEEVEED